MRKSSFNTVNGKYCCDQLKKQLYKQSTLSFNTVNGKYCCDARELLRQQRSNEFQYRKR